MGKTIPQQHPAVVLRSHYKAVRSLFAVALIAVLGLSAAVVILATNDDADNSASNVAAVQRAGAISGARFDGGPEEGTRGATNATSSTASPATRFDGGPEEGSHNLSVTRTVPPDLSVHRSSPNVRQDGGPEEGSQEIQLRRSAPNPTTPPPLGGPRP